MQIVAGELVWRPPPARVPAQSQGYGRVDLSKSLPLDGGLAFNLTVWDGANAAVGDGESFQVCLRVLESGGDVRVTVAWTDPPAVQFAGRALVNDLDLTVTSSTTGSYWTGNTPLAYNSLTGFVPVHDRLNNVEQVTVPAAAAGDVVAVQVYGASVPLAPQAFAMVVTGSHAVIENSACAELSSACPGGCSGNGECLDGRCHCSPLLVRTGLWAS